MLYQGKRIGASDQPEYSAARWLLNNNAAAPDDRLETYRGEMLCMSGIVGELVKLMVIENAHGNPTFELRRYVAPPSSKERPPVPEMASEDMEAS